MEKIDRLGWAAGLSFVSYGARLGIRVNDPAVMDQLPQHLPPVWRPSPSPVVDDLFSLVISRNEAGSRVRRYHLLYCGAARLARTMDLNEAFQTLETHLHLHVAAGARRRLFIRAGVVGWRGRALVLVGRDSSGTTTLVRALVRAGAAYYSDEYAVLDARGRVHPYPKSLSARGPDDGQRQTCPAEELGGCPGRRPLPVGLIAVAEYREGARWRPRLLSPAEALLALLSNAVPAQVRPEFALGVLRDAVSGAVALKGRRGEAQDAAMPLLSHLG
jgi:hypothetical protein